MPLLDFDSAQTWQELYEDQFTRTVHPSTGLYAARAQRLVALGITATDRVLIAGCGHGWLIEALCAELGITVAASTIYGLEPSTWVHSNLTERHPDAIIVDDAIRSGGQLLARLRQATGDDVYNWVITEDVWPVMDDTEIGQLLPLTPTLLAPGEPESQIVHIVTPFDPNAVHDPRLNWKTLEAWDALAPTHSWTDHLGRVL